MSEGPTGDEKRSGAKSSAGASGGAPSEPPPPSSSRIGFIGTNIDTAQAYVPPTALPETPEPPAPNAKVALAEAVDPRKAPTHPNLKKAAQVIAAEMSAERKPPPRTAEQAPDSQASGVRRGAGYAPSRSGFPPPVGQAPRDAKPGESRPAGRDGKPASERRDVGPSAARDARQPASARSNNAASASTADARRADSRRANALAATAVSRRPASLRPPADATETPAQRRAALLLVFLFAALLAVAVYFFLRRAPGPNGLETAPSATLLAPSPPPTFPVQAPRSAPTTQPTTEATAEATVAPVATTPTSLPRSPTATAEPSAMSPATTSPVAVPSQAPTASPKPGEIAPQSPEKPKSDRWF